MRKLKISCRFFILLILAALVFLHLIGVGIAADSWWGSKKKKKTNVITEVELQSEVMGFADRLESVLFQSFVNFDASKPDVKTRNFVLGDIVYTMSAAFTIAAQPNPEVALLDMIVIVSLGRSIYEINHRQTFGKSVNAIVKGFKILEKDIWRIAARVLDPAQQQELNRLIPQWRRTHPDQTAYSYIRFGDFAKDRTRSTLVPKGKTGGLFKSVKEATQQVEETRMLAERGMYLATRLPLLAGNFAEYWMSNLLANPQVFEILNNLNRVTAVSERLAGVTEQLPQQISVERTKTIKQIAQEMSKLRQATIDQTMKEVNTWSDLTLNKVMEKVAVEREAAIHQLMNRLADEREHTIQDFIAEEQRVRGLVTELRGTLAEGNNLVLSATTLAEKLNLDKPAAPTDDATPFEIQDYRDAIADVTLTVSKLTTLVEKIDGLLASDGLGRLMSQIDQTIGKVEGEGEKIIDHTFRQAIFLILIWLVGYVLVKLILQRLAKK